MNSDWESMCLTQAPGPEPLVSSDFKNEMKVSEGREGLVLWAILQAKVMNAKVRRSAPPPSFAVSLSASPPYL